MSINRLVSIKVPILDAQAFLGIDHDKDIPFMTRLATLAEKEIGIVTGKQIGRAHV